MKAIAYVDGSYDKKNKRYSCGVVLFYNDREYHYKESFDDEYREYWQVAGEIKGAISAMQLCLKNEIKELDLYYDYIGIEKWYKDEWRANNILSLNYKEYVGKIKNRLKVNFFKVKSHSNNKYNDLADKLAKEALCLN